MGTPSVGHFAASAASKTASLWSSAMSGAQRLVEGLGLDDALDGFTKTDLEFIDPLAGC